MKKTAKWLGVVIASAVCVTSAAAFTACDNEGNKTAEYTVTYYDGTETLKTEKVKEGEKATRWTPEKDGYTFVDWFATPNFSFTFDFDTAITENKSAFAQWSSASQSEDTRDYYIVGSGTSPILMASNWGKVFDETTQMTKAADKNEYTYTLDLQVGDLFQFAINSDWHNQRGVGYLTTTKLADGTEAFSGSSTIGDNSSYRLNIKCEYAGNYTFTLTTHPDDDTYETTNSSYTEENKEAFNINTLDTITWVRNGDVSNVTNVVTDFYIKGAKITGWGDVYNDATKMTNSNGVYTLEVYLKENEEFLFTSQNTVGTEVSTGTEYLRFTNVDDAGKQYVSGNASANILAKASGTYKFTYTKATNVLSVAFDATKTPAANDYYLDGTYDGGNWGDFMNAKAEHKFTAGSNGVYTIKNVALAADSELVIRAYAEGTEELTWSNGAGTYNFYYLVDSSNNFVKPEGGTNIKVANAGNYDISFDSYSKIISIDKADESDDAYIVSSKSGEGGWKVADDYKMTYDAATKTYSIRLTLAEGEEFGVRVMQGKTTTQRNWYASGQVSGTAPAGILVSGSSNIKCTNAGTYNITCTITDTGATIAITAAA